MISQMERRHLAQAEEHVATGERRIARHRSLVAELERGRHDTAEAKKLLDRFEETQALHVASLKTIQSELAASMGAIESTGGSV